MEDLGEGCVHCLHSGYEICFSRDHDVDFWKKQERKLVLCCDLTDRNNSSCSKVLPNRIHFQQWEKQRRKGE